MKVKGGEIFPHEYESLLGTDPDITLTLDGKLVAALPEKAAFKTLRLESKKAIVTCDRPGEIVVTAKRILIKISPPASK